MVCCAVLAACVGEHRTSLRFGLAAAPLTLDPRYATDAASERIDRLIYRRLTDFDEHSRPIPSLGHWRRLDPLHYRVALGTKGRRFHDGSRLTARDVKATYDSVLAPGSRSAHRTMLVDIERIEVVDDDTVDFYLRRADPLFPGRLGLGILPARLIAAGHAFATQPVGSGPCAFVSWPDENRLRLRRVADGQIIEFLRVADPTMRVLKLLRGEIDMMQNDLPPELVAYLRKRKEVRVVDAPGTTFSYLGFNLEDPVTGRIEVRRAIAYAIDRPAIVQHLLHGAARLASALLPPEHWAGDPDLPLYDYDPERARALLRQAGFDGSHRAHIVYKTSTDPLRLRLATVIQAELARVGIDVTVRSYDWGTLYGDIKAGKFQMFSLSWVGVNSPDIFRYIFHSTAMPPAGANRGRFRSPVADRLIEQAETAPDAGRQASLYRQLQRLLLDELPYVPLWYEDQIFVERRGIRGYRVSAAGNYDGLVTVHRTLP
jgi:peptide/nickel transport system substrate-binding protein